jgi:hypothetical protein
MKRGREIANSIAWPQRSADSEYKRASARTYAHSVNVT